MILILGGCHPRGDDWLDGVARDPLPDTAPVDLYYDGTAPTRSYKAICLIRVVATSGPAVLARMRKQARLLGAQGVVFTQRGSHSSGSGFGAPNGLAASSSSSNDVVEGLGIIYTDEKPAAN